MSSESNQDVLFVAGRSNEGDGHDVLRARDGKIEIGRIQPVKEGHALKGEVVRLAPHSEHPRLFDVRVVASREALAGPHPGPAQVASQAYRDNWDAVFAARRRDLPN